MSDNLIKTPPENGRIPLSNKASTNSSTPSAMRQSRIRRKANIPVELELTNGIQIYGSVFIDLDSRVLDLMNDEKNFFPIRLEDQTILIINRASVAICRPLESG